MRECTDCGRSVPVEDFRECPCCNKEYCFRCVEQVKKSMGVLEK